MPRSQVSADFLEEPEWGDFFEGIRRLEQHKTGMHPHLGAPQPAILWKAPPIQQTSGGVSLTELGLLLDADLVENLLLAEPPRPICPSKGMISLEEHLAERGTPEPPSAPDVVPQISLVHMEEPGEGFAPPVSRPSAELVTPLLPAGPVAPPLFTAQDETGTGPLAPPPFLIEPPIQISEATEDRPAPPRASRGGLFSSVSSFFGKPKRR